MTNIVNKYETIFVLDAALQDEEIEALVEKFKSLIQSEGTIENIDVWGKKRLAYPINYKTEGYYVLINFESNSSFPKELDRIYKITEGVLRSIIIVKEKYE